MILWCFWCWKVLKKSWNSSLLSEWDPCNTHLMAILPYQENLVTWYQNVSILDFIGAKDDGDGGDNWSYKTCKAAISYNIPTSSFLQVRCPCVIQLSMSEQRKNIKFHRLAYQAYLGSTSLVFAHQRLLVTLGECCELSCQPFSTSTLCTMEA